MSWHTIVGHGVNNLEIFMHTSDTYLIKYNILLTLGIFSWL